MGGKKEPSLCPKIGRRGEGLYRVSASERIIENETRAKILP